MIRLLSLPMIITSGISLILGIFFMLLYYRLSSRYQEPVRYYFIFSLSALVSSVFLGAFTVLINSGENLDYLDIANRVTIISAMFTIVLGLHFYVSFFDYKAPVSLKWFYVICTLFSLLCLVPNRYFLAKEFYTTSRYYTGLAFGPLFQLWGAWILILSVYSIMVLFRVYLRQRKKQDDQSTGTVRLLLAATTIWMITGIGDDLTGIQVVDLPPLTWVGSFLVTCCIAWILVLHIDHLYEDRRLLSNRLMYDQLTEAFSRSYFEVRLAEAIKIMQRNDLIGLYVCMFDVDDFKSVNDRYGHTNGDRVLQGIARIARSSIRPSDCAARLGGDEFALLLTGIQDDDLAVMIVERIRKSISKARFGDSFNEFSASCSFGLVRAGREHLKIDDLPDLLLTYADQALYVSKHQGKNAVSVSTLPVSESDAFQGSRQRA
jgi:diguanylate cyclase (GGDEF)-like protein